MSKRPGRKTRDKDRSSRRLRSSLGFWAFAAVAVLLIAYIATLEIARPHPTGDRLRIDGFTELVEVDPPRIKSAVILDQDRYVEGTYEKADGTIARFNMPFSRQATLATDNLNTLLVSNSVPTRVDQQLVKAIAGPATTLLPALMVVIVFFYFMLSMRRGEGLFGSGNVTDGALVDDVGVTFKDVAGQDNAVGELRELSDFLANADRYDALGAQIPRGILLYGPPGCGKTLMARALAGEAGAAFFSISGSDFVEMYVGIGAARVRELFKNARERAPAIVFIDELDSVGRRRAGAGIGGGAGAGGSAEEQGQALNQLLAEIDGFSGAQGVIVVGATNRPDVLDPALLRPGRFDRAVGLELPDERGRAAVLAVHARGKPLDADADLASIARRTVGMTGADLAGLFNEAALLTARDRRHTITQDDLDRALERVREAPERQRRLSMRDRRVGQARLQDERVTFADVAGMDHVIAELSELSAYLADRSRFDHVGARVPRGYLLAGPAGTGKTLLAHALAGESNATFVAVAATEFVESFLGEGAARVRDLFAQARGMAPVIVFIDELDAVGAYRGGALSDNSERAQTLNQLLVELDSSATGAAVVVVAATNRLDLLDPALMRPGRFDRTITLEMPDVDARRAILQLHMRRRRMAPDIDLDAVARLTYGVSGAALEGLVNEAALLAVRGGHDHIDQAMLEEALDRTGVGLATARPLSDRDRLVVAYHEAGHGLAARALPGGRVLHKISIVARGAAAGVTWLPESDDRRLHSRSVLIERMATLLGGRVAEEIVFGEHSDGAANDLAQVGTIAHKMVAVLGMSAEAGAINYDETLGRAGSTGYSEETARIIDAEVRRLVREAEQLAREVLMESRVALDRVVEALLERETLTLEQVDIIAGPAPAPAARA